MPVLLADFFYFFRFFLKRQKQTADAVLFFSYIYSRAFGQFFHTGNNSIIHAGWIRLVGGSDYT